MARVLGRSANRGVSGWIKEGIGKLRRGRTSLCGELNFNSKEAGRTTGSFSVAMVLRKDMIGFLDGFLDGGSLGGWPRTAGFLGGGFLERPDGM